MLNFHQGYSRTVKTKYFQRQQTNMLGVGGGGVEVTIQPLTLFEPPL